MLGVSAGLFWAASDTSIKALSGELGDSAWTAIVFSPLAVVIASARRSGWWSRRAACSSARRCR